MWSPKRYPKSTCSTATGLDLILIFDFIDSKECTEQAAIPGLFPWLETEKLRAHSKVSHLHRGTD